MNIRYDNTSSQVYLSDVTNEDIAQACAIRETMRTKGWEILMRYWTYAREAIINSGIKDSKFNEQVHLSPQKWARLDGFQEAMAIPDRIIRRVDQEMETYNGKTNSDE